MRSSYLPLILALTMFSQPAQGQYSKDIAQGQRFFQLADLLVKSGSTPQERILSFRVQARSDAPKEQLFLVFLIAEQGLPVLDSLQLESSAVGDCSMRVPANQVPGWRAFVTCRVSSSAGFVGWSGRGALDAEQFASGRLEVKLDGLPATGLLAVAISRGGDSDKKEPRDTIISNALAQRLGAPQ